MRDQRDEEGMDLRALVSQLWDRRWLILAFVVVFTVLLTAAALLTTPVYRATTILIPTSMERDSLSASIGSALGSVGGLASLAGLSLGTSDAATQEALAVLRSRQFTERFIVDLNLMPKLYKKQWDEQRKAWHADVDEPPTLAKAYKYFDKRIRTVVNEKKTGLVSIQIDWNDPVEAAFWANELARRLNEEMRGRSIEKSSASMKFLEQELLATSLVATRDAISRLIETQVEQRMLANVTQEFAFRTVDAAMPSDEDDPVWPRKMLMIVAGPVFGFGVGVVVALALGLLLGSPAPARPEK